MHSFDQCVKYIRLCIHTCLFSLVAFLCSLSRGVGPILHIWPSLHLKGRSLRMVGDLH